MTRPNPALSDGANRGPAINSCFEQLYELDREIEAAIEKYVKVFRGSKTDIKKRLRTEFQLPGKVVAARYAAYKLEREAGARKDGATAAAIEELWKTVPVGGQSDFLAAIEDAAVAHAA